MSDIITNFFAHKKETVSAFTASADAAHPNAETAPLKAAAQEQRPTADGEEHSATIKEPADELAAKEDALAEEIAAREEELAAREEELKTKEDALAEEIAAREEELAAREEELKTKEDELAEEIAAREEGLAAREEALKAKEKEMEAKQAALNQQSAMFATKRKQTEKEMLELTSKASDLSVRETTAKQLQDKYAGLASEVSKQKADLDNREKLLNVREENIKRQEQEQQAALQVLQNEINEKRSQAEADLAQAIDARRLQMQTQLLNDDTEIREKRRRELDASLDKERTTRITSMDAELASRRQRCEAELKKLEEELEEARAKYDTWLNEENNKLKNAKDEFDTERAKLEQDRIALESEKKELEWEKRLHEQLVQQLENTVETRTNEKFTSKEAELNCAQEELNRLREQLRDANGRLQTYESIKAAWGSDPSGVFDELGQLRRQVKELQEELAKRPTSDIEKEYYKLKDRYEELQERCRSLTEENELFCSANEKLEKLNRENHRLLQECDDLKFDLNDAEGRVKKYKQELERHTTPEGAAQDREQRLQEIRVPYLKNDDKNNDIPSLNAQEQPQDEITWLNVIDKKCREFGIVFPQRILYAFHTALKIADWSSVTVLAGVSGTGKSELPRLYSAFGGINFISVPVQPNWDSQESMLGYFNTIDNRFDAQPLLRFLVQCTNTDSNAADSNGKAIIDPTRYPHPLGNTMGMALLDEMNLAHVEHYFADFLSKLELRRGLVNREVPTIEVKLGAGYEPYKLPLTRNILWVGTMNQDETTKNLSDKVLDRGVVINFPRPTALKSRLRMAKLKDMRLETLLSYKTWSNWCTRDITALESSSAGKAMKSYRTFVEDINNKLDITGRAIGHRVWQSIEYYVANYPTVKCCFENNNNAAEPGSRSNEDKLQEALKTAFEDQIVQKIMPKLRGIETTGKEGAQLKAIKNLLIDNGFDELLDDYDNALECGYGQFSWNSAHYLHAEDNGSPNAAEEDTGKTIA